MEFIKSVKFYGPIVYIILGVILYNIVKIIIGKISKNKMIDKKKMTIISLIKNIIKYLICIFVVLAILSVYGVDTTGIIASLGVAGVVIGLALQDVAADFVAGVLILFDDQYTIGDTVLINGFKGEVISFGLMSTKIKAATGEVMVISNSSFKEVINYSNNKTSLLINVDVSYETDISKLEDTLKKMEEEVLKLDDSIEGYQLLGINEFSASSIKYLVALNCDPANQFQIKREINKILFRELKKAKIEIPYNKLDVNVRGKNE